MLNRIHFALLLILACFTPSIAANDIPTDAYPDIVIKKFTLTLKNKSTLKVFARYYGYDNILDSKACKKSNIDTDDIYKAAFSYKESPLMEVVDGYSEVTYLLNQYVFVNKDDKVTISRDDIQSCSGVLYHSWSSGGPYLSSFYELEKDAYHKIKSKKPYGLAHVDNDYNHLLIISYNKDFIDYQDIDVNMNIYDDVYLKAKEEVYSKSKEEVTNSIIAKYGTGFPKDLIMSEMNKKVIEELYKKKAIGIILLEILDNGDI